MSKWNADSGILRKKQPRDKHDDLLVFGYACKLFRDDEKALFIDQGKHLIPWMGDDALKIDRYDGRGALSELMTCEASREGYDAMRWLGLSESERRIEQLCDEERYYSLRNNEEDEALYQEEELKRLQKKNNEFQYSYDVPGEEETMAAQRSTDVQSQDEVEAFVPPPELDVPVNIPIPKTSKENSRIEKTANFVHRQGPQMEILIKAKQRDNPQFAFMNPDDALYKYYRHVLAAIKDGRYKIKSGGETESAKETGGNVGGGNGDQNDSSIGDEHYLHPSLLTVQTPQAAPLPPPPPPPAIPYKPSADCAYSQLVNRIQGATAGASDGKITTTAATEQSQAQQQGGESATSTQMSYEQQQQYYQYYYAAQYYEYYKQMAQYQGQTGEGGADANFYNQYLQQTAATNPYAQIVSNLHKGLENESAAAAATSLAPCQNQCSVVDSRQQTAAKTQSSEKILNPKPLLSLAQYGSDDDDDDDDSDGEVEDVGVEPPGDIKIIVDKMAAYVAKNGVDFEAIVRSKGDPRFSFLDPGHEHHPYYKRQIAKHSPEKAVKEERTSTKATPEINSKEQNGLAFAAKSKEKKPIAPVSFSIKKPKEDVPKEIKSALPAEESDEEGSTPPPPTEEKNANATTAEPKLEQQQQQQQAKETSDALEVDDPILEMIDLTDDSEEKRDARRAEDRIKDKLAAAAREKLASVSRDRALQLERRKKAAAFLKMKVAKVENGGGAATEEEKPTPAKETAEKKDPAVVSLDGKVEIVDTDSEEGEIKRRRSGSRSRAHKASKKKKSHKRKRSRNRYESRNRKKSKKKRRRTGSSDEDEESSENS